MVKLTRVVAVLYGALATAAAVHFGWEKVAVVVGPLTMGASVLANLLPDGTWYDAVCNGLAINVVPGKTAAK